MEPRSQTKITQEIMVLLENSNAVERRLLELKILADETNAAILKALTLSPAVNALNLVVSPSDTAEEADRKQRIFSAALSGIRLKVATLGLE
jgi:hypothetical protein